MRILIAVGLFALSLAAARADDSFTQADVVCSSAHDIALVRFTLTEDNGPAEFTAVPASADGGLSKDKGAKRSDCTTRWGAAIRVRDGRGQMFAYGMGGADPPGFFSLWVDKHHVFSRREWKPGYGDTTGAMTVGLVIRPDRLTVCSVPYNGSDDGRVTCVDKPLKLADHAIDAVEYPDKPVAQRAVGTAYVNAKSLRFEMCRQRLAKAGDLAALDRLDAVAMTDEAGDEGVGVLHRVPGTFANFAGLQVFVYGNTNHYFDGDVVVAVPANVTAKDVAAWFAKVNFDQEAGLEDQLPEVWHLWAGGRERLYPKVSPRYVHFAPQKINGQLFFYATPTNWDVEPAAALILPRADGGFELSCAFHEVKAHF